jgi:phosphomannomutase
MSSSRDGPLMVSVSGVRGIVGKTMTPEVAARFAGAVGTWLVRRAKAAGSSAAPSVALTRDGRNGGEAIYHAAAAGLLASGCDVRGYGIAMTPTLAVFADVYGASAGMQITASHNPQEWNGLKVVVPRSTSKEVGPGAKADACAPAAALAGEIVRIFQNNETAWAPGGASRAGYFETGECGGVHPKRVLGATDEVCEGAAIAVGERGYRAIVDDCNASGAIDTPLLFDRLRCGYRSLYAMPGMTGPSGMFPHTPEPTEANLTELAAEVKKHRADIGFAQDPDADRLAVIDENGRYIGEEYTLVLAALALAEFGALGKGSVIAVNLSTSRMIEDVAAKVGASVVRTPVGEANVVEAMKKLGPERCPLGGEGNGGVIWPRVTYVRDSLSGMALVLALMAKTGKTVSQLVSGVPSYAIVKRKVDVRDRAQAQAAGEAVAGHFGGGKGAKVDTQDGVRLDFDDATPTGYGRAWLHVRASNTEPVMRLIAEAPTKEQAERLLDEAAAVIG